jgi:hypothetical protein
MGLLDEQDPFRFLIMQEVARRAEDMAEIRDKNLARLIRNEISEMLSKMK